MQFFATVLAAASAAAAAAAPVEAPVAAPDFAYNVCDFRANCLPHSAVCR